MPLAVYEIFQLRYLVSRPRRLIEYLDLSRSYRCVSDCRLVMQTRKSSIVTAMIIWSFTLVIIKRQGSDFSCLNP